ncbi:MULTISPECIES: hypothetical protein [unclassified Nocardioides]|uniref:hypothetical protein n=1 Tax=unclassified Nocardioides TaxID=2615069 RepID=UPI0000EB633A|nr:MULTISPECIES: hypothetical protein [unclassified Nocardioides]ABL83511.1 hypothetical protein Noca_4014 [Nocardioides sp. JS614]
MKSTRGTWKRLAAPISAAALAGVVLPMSASAPAAGQDDTAKPAFSGFSSSAWAAPVKVEIYEPTIPIPANPQMELEMGYSKVEADSGSSLGRASWLWPGDSIGEGAKTVIENLGLPEQLSGPLAAQGYPVQVNASQPSGEAKASDEPFPGTVMRTSAGAKTTVAQVGFSPDNEVRDGSGDGGDGGDGGGAPGLPGVPGLPPIPGLPGSAGGGDLLQQFGQAITGSAGLAGAADDPQDDPPGGSGAPGLPPQVAALVDFEGYASTSKNVVTDSKVVASSRSALGDVYLLGGTVVLNGVVVTSTSSSDGAKGSSGGKATLGGLTIAGQEFSFGPGGAEGAGQHADVPAVPDQATAALDQLGIKLILPKPDLAKQGDQASSTMAGLVVEIDTAKLRGQLDALPIDDIVNAFPNDPPDLKKALQTLVGLSPRIVVTLGNAGSEVDTVQGIELPTGDLPDNDPAGSGDTGGPAAAGGPTAAGGSPSAIGPGPTGSAPSAAGDLGDAQLTGSGLPPLYSIPGAILVASLALAAVGGTWLRRIGAIALGGAGSCTHGLDSGLPDLRKA